jgi:hypothetical protein
MRYDLHPTEIGDYIEQKAEMLKKDFHIKLSAKETRHLYLLSTEIAVDNYIRTIIQNKL